MCEPQGTEKRNAYSSHHVCIRLLTVTSFFILLYFFFPSSLLEPFLLRSNYTDNLSTPETWTIVQPGHFQPLAFFVCFCSTQSTRQKRVCYGGPVKTASTGAKPTGAGLNGWAVRQPVLWWETQTCAASDGRDIGSCRLPSKRGSHARTVLKMGLEVGGVLVGRNSESLSGDYELHLCFQVWHIF